jgi:hypothetical protein
MNKKSCITCMRGPQYAEGCSHIDCPHRKPYTAQPVDTGPVDTTVVHIPGGYARVPSMRGDE